MRDDTSEPGRYHLGDVVGELPGVGGLGPGFEGGGVMRPTVPPAGERPAGVPDEPPVPLKTAVLYSSGNFGAGFYYGLNSFILPVLLLSLKVQPVLNNLLSSTRSIEGTVVQPIVGAWSDRTWKSFLGRRRFFVVLFAPLSALFIVLTPFAANLRDIGKPLGIAPANMAIILVALTIFLFTFTFNIMYDPYNALLADITPERQRGRVNGIFQAISASGQVIVLSITLVFVILSGGVPLAAVGPICIIVAAMLLVFFIPTVLGIREPRTLPQARTGHKYTWRDYWRGLRADSQVLLYFANQFLLWFGISAIQFNLIYYANLELHLLDFRQFLLPIVLLLMSAIPVWPLGILSDRVGLKRIYLFGVICMSAAAIAGTITQNFILILIILAVAGVGNAAQTASSYPLLTRIVFPDQMGLYTGLSAAITSIAGPLAAVLSGLTVGSIDHPHFERLFPLVAGIFIASVVPLAILRIDKSVFQRTRRAAVG